MALRSFIFPDTRKNTLVRRPERAVSPLSSGAQGIRSISSSKLRTASYRTV